MATPFTNPSPLPRRCNLIFRLIVCINFNYYLLFFLHAFTCTIAYFIFINIKKKKKKKISITRISAKRALAHYAKTRKT